MSLLTFSIKGRSENATKFVAQARQFELIVDEPASLGGNDEAANPVEYVLAGYAGCLNVVGHLVAKEQGLDLGGLEIDIEGDLDPAKFLGHSRLDRSGFQAIAVRLIPGNQLPKAKLDAWLREVSDRCPVSDNLSSETPVELFVSTAAYARA
ncbi:MAG: OsmC family protein [Bacteroidia bacterium]|nr:OsmC family protein [Bacteroidia bacterium]